MQKGRSPGVQCKVPNMESGWCWAVDVAYGLVVIYIESVDRCGWGCINADTRREVGVSLSGGHNRGEESIQTHPTSLYPILLPAWWWFVMRLAVNCTTSIQKEYIQVKQLQEANNKVEYTLNLQPRVISSIIRTLYM